MKSFKKRCLKLGVIVIAFVGTVLPLVYMNNRELQASSEILNNTHFPTPKFTQYDKIIVGDVLFTVFDTTKTGGVPGSRNKINALADEVIASDMTNLEIRTFQKNKSKMEEKFGSTIHKMNSTTGLGVAAKIGIPDASGYGSAYDTGTKSLNAQIPKVANDWWTSAINDTRGEFVTGDNKFKSISPLIKVVRQATGTKESDTCVVKSEQFPGMKPLTNNPDAVVNRVHEVYTYDGVLRVNGLTGTDKSYLGFSSADASSSTACKDSTNRVGLASIIDDLYGVSTPAMTGFASFDKSVVSGIEINHRTKDPKVAFAMALGVKFDATKSFTNLKSMTATAGECVDITKYCTGGVCTYDGSDTVKSVYWTKSISGNIGFDYTLRNKRKTSAYTRVPCTITTSNEAGIADFRPTLNIDEGYLLFANPTIRSYDLSPQISEPIPAADTTSPAGTSRQYVTLLDNTLGIKTSSTKVDADENGIISFPVTLNGVAEGTRYVSAVATKKDGTKVYGILKAMTGTTGTVELDISNLKANADSTYTITLYQEDGGSKGISYMGPGQEVTITVVQSQKIAFNNNLPSTVTYGDTVTITSHLSSDLASQANTNITYSITSSGAAQASIVSQSYNPTTGIATADIKPLNGTGQFTVAIDKAGAGSTVAASRKTMNITMNKKGITVKPNPIGKVYDIGENMPALTATTSGLVSGDSLPTGLIPILEPLSASDPVHPASNGTLIDKSGKWKVVFASDVLDTLTAFTDKYDVTLEDFDEDNTLIFETGISAIPAGWVVVTPNANSEGWNKDTVVIQPSATAIAAGYNTVVLLDTSNVEIKFGSSISYTTETSSEFPRIALRKGATQSDSVTIREIKIDLSKPTVSSVISDETIWTSTAKKVTLTTADVLSGVADVSVLFGATPVTDTQGASGVYSFDADANGTYTVSVVDSAGNSTTHSVNVENIDTGALSLTATLVPFPTANHMTQDITLNKVVGNSGISSYEVYFKKTVGDTYAVLADLDQVINPLTYVAKMNGYYKFVLVNNANESVDAEVITTDLNPPIPCTQVVANLDDGSNTAYRSNTWTNKDVILTLSNTNTSITGTITWEVEVDGSGTWSPVTGNTYAVSTTTTSNSVYNFKATSSDGAIETSPTSFKVKIDKEKPSVPTIVDAAKYTSANWYGEAVKIQATTTPKPSTIGQSVYVRDTAADTWTLMSANELTLSSNGTYERDFKIIDEAGNESVVSAPITVNIDDTRPVITIELDGNTLNAILNNITLGYFFNKTVDVDMSADFGNNGTISYIIDDSATPTEPTSNDPRWTVGKTTSILPDQKVMIYVKAVSRANVETIDSSIYYVYADETDPNITLPAPQTSWTNVNKIEAVLNDALSGIDVNTAFYSINNGSDVKVTPIGGKVNIQPLIDGDYDVSVKGNDHSGNTKISTTHVKIDTVKPVVSEPSASVSGWAQKREITFTASDALSDIASDYPKVSGNTLGTIQKSDDGAGNYSFEVEENDTYVITTMDNAGNITTKTYVENNIDVTAPVISNKVIENENVIKAKKKVSFDIVDTQSGINKVTVTYLKDGVSKPVLVTQPTTGDNYFFNAQEDGEYTITVSDKAGNTTSDTVTVSKIDPNGIKIVDVSDINEWVKDEMNISFRVEAGSSGIKTGYPKVVCNGVDITPSVIDDVYSFIATENGTCKIDVENNADDVADETLVITHIDELAPVIEDISSNITSTTYREPQDITFRVSDYNVVDKSSMGSGLASGYPNLYYMDNGVKKPVVVTQDVSDETLYHFLADRNTTYIVEVVDAVGHAVVTENIVVDHIVNDSDIEEIEVIATHDSTQIASGTWVNGDITFTISGGLKASILEKYQYAITDGTLPVEADWQDISNPNDAQHIVTSEQRDKSYYFRAVPIVNGATITSPFIVNLDTTIPVDMRMEVTQKNANPIARFINVLSFGAWLNEEQVVSFEATDNYSDVADMRYEYAEEVAGVIGSWKPYTGNLSYTDTDIILHAKALDLASNESVEAVESLMVDTVAPTISGVQDQSVYKQYYLPRFISYADTGSGVSSATFSKDGGTSETLAQNHKIKGSGSYELYVDDMAGNVTTLTFKIVDLPDLGDIDGSDESKDIIDQIEKELEENRDNLDDTEIKDTEDWVSDAEDKWLDSRKTVVEDEDKTSKVEGIEDTTFDPSVELVVDPIVESSLPPLPRKAKYSYDVYLKKGDVQVQPNGNVKVYLPYPDKEAPVVYEIDENGVVREISATIDGDYVVFVSNALRKYAISNTKQGLIDDEIKVPGPDGEMDTSDDVIAKPSPEGDKPSKNPDGSVTVPPGGSVVYPDGGIVETPEGGILNPDGSLELPNGEVYDPEGEKKPNEDVTVPGPDGENGTEDDVIAKPSPEGDKPSKNPDGSVTVPPGGSVVYPDGGIVETPEGGILNPDGSLELPNGDVYDPEGEKKPNEDVDVTVPGPDGENGTEDDVIAKPSPEGDKPSKNPDGSVTVPPGGSVVYPGGDVVETPEGGILKPDGSLELPNGEVYDPEGEKKPNEDGDVTVPGPDGDNGTDDDVIAKPNPDGDKPTQNPDGSVTVPPGGSIEYPNGDVVETPDGGTLSPDGSLTLPDGTEYDPSGNKKPKVCNLIDIVLNIDTDKDGLPDLNLDTNDDCKADLNIDVDNDNIPDVQIDSTGDGKADINIDVNDDGIPDVNIVKLKKWAPDKNCSYNGFKYDTMGGLKADTNLDQNGDGNPDTGLGNNTGGANDSVLSGATTGEKATWQLWWVTFTITISTIGYQVIKNIRKKRS